MSDVVRIEIREHIAEVVLNRPQKKNALDLAMFEAIAAAGEQLAGNEELRCIVLRGEGGNFSAGLDFELFRNLPVSPQTFLEMLAESSDERPANFFQRPCMVWRDIDVPVIAAIEGVALGGGCQIALAADIRLASPDMRMSVMEVKWGLIPDMGITQVLPRIARQDVAMDLALTGRVVTAQEAMTSGLVTKVCENVTLEARRLASEIACLSPDATRRIKRLLRDAWNMPPADALRLEAKLQAEIIGRPRQIEAMRANLEKRKPRFD